MIPFNKPSCAGRELEYIREAIARWHISGGGWFTQRCHELLEKELAVPKVLLTTSCTHALEMMALLLDVGPGDEIILPSFTFVSTANAFALRGATPVFADIRRDTLNLDESRLESLITPRTKAIVVVHYAGVGCKMDVILETARRHRIPVLEDNAHGLFGRYQGRYLGTFGGMAAQSFHETKNFSCGEGGALLINDPRWIERAEILREKGTDRGRFFRGQVDKYTWVDLGSSYLPSDLLAAYLFAQLESRETICSQRRKIWERYREALAAWAGPRGIGLPAVPDGCEQTHHLFYLLMPSLEARTSMIHHLRARDVQAVFHYTPLHLSPMGRKFGGRESQCPVTEDLADRLVRLPLFNQLLMDEQDRVIEAITSWPGTRPVAAGNPLQNLSHGDAPARSLP